MPVSPQLAFSATATSGVTYVSFDVGGSYNAYTLLVPAMTSGTTLAIEVSDSAAGTYRTLYHAPTSASAPTAVEIPSGVTNAAVGIPSTVGQYFRLKHVNLCSLTANTFKILCKGS